MKKRFVTITADNHPDWTAKDWKRAWETILKKIDVSIKNDLFDSFGLRLHLDISFHDWNMWMGVDPAVDTDKATSVTFKIDAKHIHAYGIVDENDCPICIKDKKVNKKLRSYGVSEENFIVRDGKVFMNNPVLDNLLGEK